MAITMAIKLPAMLLEQEESWRAIFEIYDELPLGWVLVGGQSVYLHAVERGAITPRPTKDADFALDIRSYPHHLNTFTAALLRLGFTSAGESHTGHQHRWLRDKAVVDVLIPRFAGSAVRTAQGLPGVQLSRHQQSSRPWIIPRLWKSRQEPLSAK